MEDHEFYTEDEDIEVQSMSPLGRVVSALSLASALGANVMAAAAGVQEAKDPASNPPEIEGGDDERLVQYQKGPDYQALKEEVPVNIADSEGDAYSPSSETPYAPGNRLADRS